MSHFHLPRKHTTHNWPGTVCACEHMRVCVVNRFVIFILSIETCSIQLAGQMICNRSTMATALQPLSISNTHIESVFCPFGIPFFFEAHNLRFNRCHISSNISSYIMDYLDMNANTCLEEKWNGFANIKYLRVYTCVLEYIWECVIFSSSFFFKKKSINEIYIIILPFSTPLKSVWRM